MSIWEYKNYDSLLGKIRGISEDQLMSHFTLYQGYVKKINEIQEKLKATSSELANYSYAEYSELKRRHSVAYNGAILHELFFENLTGETTQPSAELILGIEKSFGSMDHWRQDMVSSLKSANGWVLVCRSRRDGSLCNAVIEEHHHGVLVEQDIILVIDGWEHSYMIDYGIKKEEYIKIILPALNWKIVSDRYSS